MSDYDEFHKYLEENQEAFASWGAYVSEIIVSEIKNKIGSKPYNSFVQIHAKPRVKEINSALGKVARKGYSDPISQMTDLVGTRFVVLLSQDLDFISDIIEHCEDFISVVSKNYLDEIELNPKLFDYQSKHYEIRPKESFEINNVIINKNICCEVQIRTLLQHAYAELVHDNIYKPVGVVPKAAERHIARSMALMETTDDLFCSTMKLLYETNLERNRFNEVISSIYRDCIGEGYMHYDESTNFLILDTYKEHVVAINESSIRDLINLKKFLIPRIQKRSKRKTLFSQPTILFVYYLITKIEPEKIISSWPLPGYLQELDLAFSDLGISSKR
ncbi:RelA/SpoT domain-containing protein [Kosakonia radicincitans]|uniref:GTP pyrophosphokinase n=1 Tax=Kosakonia radicincitans TaxID=283686 RepID=UPI0031D6D4AE